MGAQIIDEVIQNCKFTSQKLRAFARYETNAHIKKLLLEAAHHLDVGVAELEYVNSEVILDV